MRTLGACPRIRLLADASGILDRLLLRTAKTISTGAVLLFAVVLSAPRLPVAPFVAHVARVERIIHEPICAPPSTYSVLSARHINI